MASDSVFVGRRDRGAKQRESVPRAEFVAGIGSQLDDIQSSLFERARSFREQHTRPIDSKDEFYAFFTAENSEKPEIHGGFALSHWNGDAAVEQTVKNDLNVTIRAIPEVAEPDEGRCVITGEPSPQRVIFAKAY